MDISRDRDFLIGLAVGAVLTVAVIAGARFYVFADLYELLEALNTKVLLYCAG